MAGQKSSFIWAIALWCFFIPSILAADPTLQTLFHVKSGSTAGGCTDKKQSTLASWLTESRELAKAGVQAFDDAAKGNKDAEHALSQFLGIDSKTSAEDRKDVKELVDQVAEFYANTYKVNDGPPWMFCGSSWVTQRKRTDYSELKGGQYKHEQENCDGELTLVPLEIQDDPAYKDYMYEEENGKEVATSLVPYWSEDLGQYTFEPDYKGKGYCAAAKSLAGTQVQTKPGTILMCPSAFTNTENAATLGSRAANTNTLQQVLPRSSTFFHETFHLVHGTADTLDASYAIASLLTALKTPDEVPAGTNLDEPTKTDDGLKNVDKMTNAELVRSNPETWVYLCVSYWYTLNKGYYFPDGGKGAKVST